MFHVYRRARNGSQFALVGGIKAKSFPQAINKMVPLAKPHHVNKKGSKILSAYYADKDFIFRVEKIA